MASMTNNRVLRMPIIKLAVIVAVFLLSAIGFVAFKGSAIDDVSRLNAPGDRSDEHGKQVYTANCADCHGRNLEGQPNWRTRNSNGRLPAPPHDASGHTWHHDDQTLFNLTKYGISELVGRPIETDMPAYKDILSDDDIWAVLAFIQSQWPKKIRERQAALNAQ